MNVQDRPFVQQIRFSSDALPADLDHNARRSRFSEFFETAMCGAEFTFPAGQPFFIDYRFLRVNGVRIGRLEGTFSRGMRDASRIVRDLDDDFFVLLNRASSRVQAMQRGHETLSDSSGAILLTHGEPLDIQVAGRAGWIGLVVPKRKLCAAVAGAEDMLARALVRRSAVGGLLVSYTESLFGFSDDELDVPLARHAGATIVDLLTLMLGAERDTAEMARSHGLRAARLQQILGRIKTDFSRPGFSTDMLAAHIGLSQRYVNKLLFESGQTFAERVLELRLQKARAILADPREDRTKVSEIALACGFNEVSYFNRRFRARFGCSPTQARAGKGEHSAPDR